MWNCKEQLSSNFYFHLCFTQQLPEETGGENEENKQEETSESDNVDEPPKQDEQGEFEDKISKYKLDQQLNTNDDDDDDDEDEDIENDPDLKSSGDDHPETSSPTSKTGMMASLARLA